MSLDGDFDVPGGARIRITGLADTVKALENAGADAQDMKDLMHDIGMIVVRATSAPILSGKLQRSISAGRGKTKAVVRAGSKNVPYAAVQEYGWPKRNIKGSWYMTKAFRSTRGAVVKRLETGITEILEKNNLK